MGQTVMIGYDGGLTVNESKIVAADVEASNGVVHVIDAVLLPAAKDPKESCREVRNAGPCGLARCPSVQPASPFAVLFRLQVCVARTGPDARDVGRRRHVGINT